MFFLNLFTSDCQFYGLPVENVPFLFFLIYSFSHFHVLGQFCPMWHVTFSYLEAYGYGC